MKKYFLFFSLALIACAAVWQVRQAKAAQTNSDAARNQREALYRDNNLGVALMEQFKHEEAAKAFRKALAADAKFALARINLALALFFQNDSPAALKEAQEAVKLAPNNLTAQYALGLVLRSEKQYDEAIAAFKVVLAANAQDAGANVQVGQLYAQKQQYEAAIKAFRGFVLLLLRVKLTDLHIRACVLRVGGEHFVKGGDGFVVLFLAAQREAERIVCREIGRREFDGFLRLFERGGRIVREKQSQRQVDARQREFGVSGQCFAKGFGGFFVFELFHQRDAEIVVAVKALALIERGIL